MNDTVSHKAVNASTRIMMPIGVVLSALAVVIGIWMRDAAVPRIEHVEASARDSQQAVGDHEKRLQILETRVPLQLDQVKEDAARTRKVVEELARRQGVIVP